MNSQLQSVLITVILAVVSAAFTPLMVLLSKKLHDLIDAKVKNVKVRGILDRLDDTALTVVQSVEQTVISKLDPTKSIGDNAKIARDAALADLKTHLGQKGLNEVKQVLGIGDSDVEKILLSYIESKVHVVNQDAASKAGGAA